MEFIKHDDPHFPILGRYKYVFSSDSIQQFFNDRKNIRKAPTVDAGGKFALALDGQFVR